jgi:molybdopterin-guanine dinucleotide biosynthesis protein
MKRPFIIGVGGSCSNSGKTTLACSLLKYFRNGVNNQQGRARNIQDALDPALTEACSQSDGFQKWGAVKYTKTELYASLVDDRAALSRKEKDTGRFIDAGADEVLWVKSPPQELGEVLPVAMDRLSRLDGLIVEGNSVIEFLNPDIVIFIFGNKKTLWKTSIERLVGISDIIVYENESDLPEIAKTKRLFPGNMSGEEELQEVFSFISGLMHERKAERRNDKKGC